ncbi:MAG: segregation and condensation protein A [Ilumatobacteraceae bacterium]|jgi:segregation and condensation protein A
MAYAVDTPVFQGPFELLLHLILQEEVDVHELSLARIVEAYLAEVERMQALDLEVATEFLLIAATLLEFKARRLLPGRDGIDLDEELALWEERDLLLARLLDCKTFKDVAAAFQDLVERADRSYPRAAGPDERFAELMPDLLEGVSLRRLQRAYLRATAPKPPTVIAFEHVAPIRASVADALVEVTEYLRVHGAATFRQISAGITDRIQVVVRFLALLELFKQGRIELDQAERFGEIHVRWSDEGWDDETQAASIGAMEVDDYDG